MSAPIRDATLVPPPEGGAEWLRGYELDPEEVGPRVPGEDRNDPADACGEVPDPAPRNEEGDEHGAAPDSWLERG